MKKRCKVCSLYGCYQHFSITQETTSNTDDFYSRIELNFGNTANWCKYCSGYSDTVFCNCCSINKLVSKTTINNSKNSKLGANEKSSKVSSCKNCVRCYDCTDCISCEYCKLCYDCLDCFECKSCSYSFNCDSCKKLHQCSNCDFCENCVFCSYCLKSNNCSDSQYLTNCSYCDFCSDCEDLNGTPGNPCRYYIDNVQYSKEEYFKTLEKTNKNEMGAGETRDWIQEIKDVGAVFVDAFNRLLLY